VSALDALADKAIWLRWKLERNKKGKLTKVPYDARGPNQGSHTDPASWGSLSEAQAALRQWGGDGIGIVSVAINEHYVHACLDVDACYLPDTDQRGAWVDPAATILDGCYREISVSGTGEHYHFRVRREVAAKRRWRINAKRPSANGQKEHGFELAVSEKGGYYLTCTFKGEGELRVIEEPELKRLYDVVKAFAPPRERRAQTGTGPSSSDPDLHAHTLAALGVLANDGRFADRDVWIKIGMAVHHGTGGSAAGLRAWTSWTERLHADAENSCGRAWPTFTKSGITAAFLFKFAREDGWQDPSSHIAKQSSAKRECKARTGTDDDQHASPLQVGYEDFAAYMPQAAFIFKATGQLWPASSVNKRLPWISNGPDLPPTSPATWLGKHQPVEQMTWAPGEPQIVRDRLIIEGGWIRHPQASVFNQYKPPTIELGDAAQAKLWCDLVRRIWPGDADHIFDCLAHCRQRPNIKINHALVLGGPQGIGKDTVLEAAVEAVGPWNVHSIGPMAFVGRFNGFVKSVILRVSEARDADYNPYQFYEHEKVYAAAPPDALRVDEKHVHEFYIANVCFLIITTNHLTSGLYLPADDRRHYVAWSDLTKDGFTVDYWSSFWRWYRDEDGFRHVAAWLDQRDLSTFNPKAPPKKTEAFWTIVNAARAPEDAELADVVDKLGTPPVTTLDEVITASPGDFAEWLTDRRNRRNIPHRFEQCGYVPVRNDAADDGLWKIDGKRQVVYGRREHARRTLIERIRALAKSGVRPRMRQ
jgi:hypothetical protein